MLLLVLDGMRPGSIDPTTMPNLARIAARGVTYTRSRTGFPSETMVGAGELFSGAWPEQSGVTSNYMAVPGQDFGGVELKSLEGIDTMAAGYGGSALASTSLFQALASAGYTTAIVGKEGPAELAWRAGATWSVSSGGAHETAAARRIGAARGARPLARIAAAAGPAPGVGEHDDHARSNWLVQVAGMVDAQLAPDLLAVWLTDPDKTQHNHGLGTTNQAAALRAADAAIGRLLTQLGTRGDLDDLDIVITSDHGFSEHIEGEAPDLKGTLAKAGLGISNIIAAGNNHCVRFDHPPTQEDFDKLKSAIAASPFADDVETVIVNPRSEPVGETRRDGTLTGRDLRQGSTRGYDVYVVYRRIDEVERTDDGRRHRVGKHLPAYPGTTKAGHGSLGWTDINNTLVVSGPSFDGSRRAAQPLRTPNAAGIVDIAPTILELFGVAAPASMQGRVLREALAELGIGDGRVARVKSTRSIAWQDVVLGARTIRTGLETEHVGSTDYNVRLITTG